MIISNELSMYSVMVSVWLGYLKVCNGQCMVRLLEGL